MSVGKIPNEWSHAIVTPVYKGASASSVTNYRPISLTCVASKIMERVIVCDLLIYLRRHNVINKQQHGFLSGRSTTSNLLESICDWTLALNDSKSVAVANIDFAKAFDSVCTGKLLHKLSSYGISGQLLKWISSFLSDRSQQTRVGCLLSDPIKLSSGVVQGSVIGPLLFVLFINDITHLFDNNKCTCKLFADDMKLYTVLHTNEDYSYLQEKLNVICNWSQDWQLGISYKKCNLMYIGNTLCKPSLLLNDVSLAVVEQVKDLGVLIDSRLSFTPHIKEAVVRANVRANLIHKCFISRDVFTLVRAFKVYVRPLLEYASCTWSPHHTLKIKQIESVQRKFTKRLPGYASLSYENRLLRLDLDSLEMRRLRQDLLFTYKIVFNLINGAANNMFTLTNTILYSYSRPPL
jgi:ribonucleases P/MRP protein subunit RPP40